MMVNSESCYSMGGDPRIDCVWVENGERRYAYFNLWCLQSVYADGAPRNYETEG
jgi:hypothetical protein